MVGYRVISPSIDKLYSTSYHRSMRYFEWNSEKNTQLKAERDVCFEDIVVAVGEGKLLDVVEHPNTKKYPGQKMFIVELNGYAFLVPFVEDENVIFLKTIIPSRKATRDYLIKK